MSARFYPNFCIIIFRNALIFSALVTTSVYGQITINAADLAGKNDTVRFSNANNFSEDFTATGANFTWDF